MDLAITDPTSAPSTPWLERLGEKLLNDQRDLPFLSLSLAASVTLIPFAVALYIPGGFHWWTAVAYGAFNGLVFLDKYILMLHNTSHRPLFRPRYRLLNHYIPWVLGPLFGETPETYFAHHLGMHHPENNLKEDLSSTMRFQRDHLGHFLLYWGRFFFLGIIEVPSYLHRKKRDKLMRGFLLGELGFYSVVAGLMFLNWKATLVVLVAPFVLVRFLMMAGNWGQHAFIDARAPEDPLLNSITVINCRYNQRCYNDGYHIGHHVKANRHWTELPGDFISHEKQYAERGAIVFRGIDFFIIWALLMLHRYDTLAKHFVRLDGDTRSHEEIKALLRSRTRPIPV